MRLVDNIFNSMLEQGNSAPYIDCDYLESGGGTSAYIDTGVRIGGQGKVEIDDIVLPTGGGNVSIWLAGGRDGANVNDYTLRVQDGGMRVRYNNAQYDTSLITFNNRYKYVRDKNIITIYDGDNIHYSTTAMASASIPSYNYYLFAINNGGTLMTSGFLRKLGKARLYDENGVFVRDYSPKIRRADGVAGMYDAVNDVFYTSPNGDLFNYGYWT